MKHFLFLALLVPALAFAEPVAESQRVTFQEHAMRVPVLLEKLSAQTGVRLTATQDFRNEVVLVHVNNVPLDELLQNIARVTSGSWHVQPDDSKRLLADTSMRREELAQHRKQVEELWELDQKRQNELLEKDMERVREYMQSEEFLSMPEERRNSYYASVWQTWARQWGTRTVPKDIALEAMMGQRIVLSSSPNSLQRQMPQSVRAFLADMAENLVVRSESPRNRMTLTSEQREELRSLAHVLRSGSTAGPPNAPKALMVLQPPRFKANPEASNFVSVNALFIGSDNEHLSFKSFMALGAWARVVSPEELNRQPPADTREPIPISERSAKLLAFLHGDNEDEPRTELLRSEFIESVKDVVINDPHSYQNSDGLTGYAERHNKNLVASLPDSLWLRADMSGIPSFSIRYLEQEIKRTFEEDRGDKSWMVLKPKIAEALRAHRTDRESLKALLQVSDLVNSAPLATLAEYAANNPQPDHPLIVGWWITSFSGTRFGSSISSMGYWSQLRFIGSLSSTTRARILEGESIGFRELTMQDQQALFELLTNGFVPLSATDSEMMAKRRDLVALRYEFDRSNPLSIGRIEPTEVLGNGLSPVGRIHVKIEHHPAFARQNSGGELALYEPVHNAESFGMSLAISEQISRANTNRFDHVRMGSERRLVLSVRPFEEVEALMVFSEFSIPSDSQPIHISQLPKEIRLVAEEMVERARGFWRERLPDRGPQP